MHHPRKRFAQHFLHDPVQIARILQAIAARPGEWLVEIGPGLGALTRGLLTASGRLDVVELDRDLLTPLADRCRGLGDLRIHSGDALSFDFRALVPAGERLRVLGNLPYNISTPLLFHLLSQADHLLDMHFLLQREVVARLAAPPGIKDYGRLSVMVQAVCEVEALFMIGPEAFTPPPRVLSALVRLQPLPKPQVATEHQGAFARLVALAFQQRRKTLRNALSSLLDEGQIRQANVDPGLRPECLGVADFARLATRFSSQTNTVPL